MKVSDNVILNEKGFSLVELLAALTLFSLIAGIIYSTISFGFDSYYKVNIESSLRDEGDLVTTAIINKMYTFSPTRIDKLGHLNGIILVNKTEDKEDRLEIKLAKDPKDIKQKGSLFIGSLSQGSSDNLGLERYELKSEIDLDETTGSKITLECQNTTECVTGVIKIKLVLKQEYKGIPQTLTLESKFGF